MQRRRGHMSLEMLWQILTEVADYGLADVVTYHLMGEPLIHPQIFEAIAIANELGLNLHLTTNGSTLALRADHHERLIASAPPKVTISLQTPEADTYGIRGAPAKLSAAAYFAAIERYVLDNLEQGYTRVHLKFLDTSPHPFLVPQAALDIASDRETLKHYLETWALRLGFAPQFDSLRQGRWQTFTLHERLTFETFPLDSWGNTHTEAILPAQFGYCNGARDQAGILCDGTVVPCCKDYEGVLLLGHVSEQPLRKILEAPAACHMRRSFDRWQIPNPVCQRCLGADTPSKRLLRQVGSIAYFQVYSPWRRRLDPAWGEV